MERARCPAKSVKRKKMGGQVVFGLGVSLLPGKGGTQFCSPVGDLLEVFKMEQPPGCWHRQVWPTERRLGQGGLPWRLCRPLVTLLQARAAPWLSVSHLPPSFFLSVNFLVSLGICIGSRGGTLFPGCWHLGRGFKESGWTSGVRPVK